MTDKQIAEIRDEANRILGDERSWTNEELVQALNHLAVKTIHVCEDLTGANTMVSNMSRGFHREAFTRLVADKLYEEKRLLENAVRKHAHEMRREFEGPGGKLVAQAPCIELLRRIPKHPRKSIREIRRGR